ncbi:MAG: hypothetical protein M0036_01490 [Desulfobacteraceae bacterium]|nr:hypothetical protein [Desulfobacteraceae bacterium]
MTAFIIEHQCPQCGAPAELEETDRLFQCGYCRVKSCLDVPGPLQYILPHRAPSGKELIYFPYWRFKGMLFYCLPGEIKNRFVDFSMQAIASPDFPFSLGLRTQTQKLRFAIKECEGLFLPPELPKAELIADLHERFSAEIPKPILHQAQIGETISILYAPFYLDTRLVDAILNRPVGNITAEAIAPLLTKAQAPQWSLTFLSTLCPQCGWDLEADKNALVLNCANCRSTWRPKGGKLEALKSAHVPAPGPEGLYLPFWRIQCDIAGVTLDNYADLIRLANLPRVAQPGDQQRPFYFWCPAFKVRPQNFLTFAAQATTCQVREEILTGPPPGQLHSVNLPLQEAVESLILTFAGFARPKQHMEEILKNIRIQARSALLVYLPFEESPHEFIRPVMNLAIAKNLLKLAKNL